MKKNYQTKQDLALIEIQKRYDLIIRKYEKLKKECAEIVEELSCLNFEIKNDKYISISGIEVDMPFVPSSNRKIEVMMELLGNINGKKAADLGCGDGKVLLELARRGAIVDGFELEPKLAKNAQVKVESNGFNCNIINKSFFEADLSQYEVLTIYGITSVMEKLEKKLECEMKPNSLLVSNTFVLPHWLPVEMKYGVFLYQKNEVNPTKC